MITGIYLNTSNKDCTNPAYVRTWAGTEEYSNYKNDKGIKDIVDETGPIVGSVYKDGVFICLERGSASWSDTFVSTNDDQGYDCPPNKVPCIAGSVFEQTVCVAPDALDKNCPITDVKIVNKVDFDDDLYKDYTKAEFRSDEDDLSWWLLYSRTYAGPPIERFDLTQQRPCSLDGTF